MREVASVATRATRARAVHVECWGRARTLRYVLLLVDVRDVAPLVLFADHLQGGERSVQDVCVCVGGGGARLEQARRYSNSVQNSNDNVRRRAGQTSKYAAAGTNIDTLRRGTYRDAVGVLLADARGLLLALIWGSVGGEKHVRKV